MEKQRPSEVNDRASHTDGTWPSGLYCSVTDPAPKACRALAWDITQRACKGWLVFFFLF